MPSKSRFRGRLAERLSRLAETLETIGIRLRDAVASAVGQSLAGAISEGVSAALNPTLNPNPHTHPPPSSRYQPRRPSSLWDDRDAYHHPDDYDDTQDDDYDQPEPTPAPASLPQRQLATRTLAMGLQAAAWWLKRQTGKFPVLTAALIGLFTAGIGYLGWTFGASWLAALRPAWQLTTLANVVQALTSLLAQFSLLAR